MRHGWHGRHASLLATDVGGSLAAHLNGGGHINAINGWVSGWGQLAGFCGKSLDFSIFRMTGGSSIHATTRYLPPHLGQRSTFTPKTRAISSARSRLRLTMLVFSDFRMRVSLGLHDIADCVRLPPVQTRHGSELDCCAAEVLKLPDAQ